MSECFTNISANCLAILSKCWWLPIQPIDVWEGTSGTSADVPRFGLEIYSVSNAILDEYIFKNKFCEIEDLTLFTDRILAK